MNSSDQNRPRLLLPGTRNSVGGDLRAIAMYEDQRSDKRAAALLLFARGGATSVPVLRSALRATAAPSAPCRQTTGIAHRLDVAAGYGALSQGQSSTVYPSAIHGTRKAASQSCWMTGTRNT